MKSAPPIIPDAHTGRNGSKSNHDLPSGLEEWGGSPKQRGRGRPRNAEKPPEASAELSETVIDPKNKAVFKRAVVTKFSSTPGSPYHCRFCSFEHVSIHSVMMHTNKAHRGMLPSKPRQKYKPREKSLAIQQTQTQPRLSRAAQQAYEAQEGDPITLSDLKAELASAMTVITAIETTLIMKRRGLR